MRTYILTIQLECEDGQYAEDFFNTDGTLHQDVLAVDKTRVLYYVEAIVPHKQRIPSTFTNSGNKVKKTRQKPSKKF